MFRSTNFPLESPCLIDVIDRQGLATAPILLAAEEYPELNTLIARQFQEAGDVEKVRWVEFIYLTCRGVEQ